MNHTDIAVNGRSASEIMAESRRLQERHAPRVLGVAVRRLWDAVAREGHEPNISDGRQLTVH